MVRCHRLSSTLLLQEKLHGPGHETSSPSLRYRVPKPPPCQIPSPSCCAHRTAWIIPASWRDQNTDLLMERTEIIAGMEHRGPFSCTESTCNAICSLLAHLKLPVKTLALLQEALHGQGPVQLSLQAKGKKSVGGGRKYIL